MHGRWRAPRPVCGMAARSEGRTRPDNRRLWAGTRAPPPPFIGTRAAQEGAPLGPRRQPWRKGLGLRSGRWPRLLGHFDSAPACVVALKRDEPRFRCPLHCGARELEGGDSLEPRCRSALHHPDGLARERCWCRARTGRVTESQLLTVLRLHRVARQHLFHGPPASGSEPSQGHRRARAAAPFLKCTVEFYGHIVALLAAARELEEESEALRLEQLAQPARPAVPTAAHDYEGSRHVCVRHAARQHRQFSWAVLSPPSQTCTGRARTADLLYTARRVLAFD